jgi:hypothetical protein
VGIAPASPFPYHCIDLPGRQSARLQGSFSDEDARDFALFTEAEVELGECEYVLADMPLDVTVKWDAGVGFSPVRLPPTAHVSEFLHRLRPFLLEGEATSFLRILSLVGRYYADPPLRDNLKLAKQTFLGRESQRYYQFRVEDLLINSDAALKVWLNAFEYHRDLDKRAYLGDLASAVPLDVMKVFFLDTLRDKATAIFWLAMFLRCALRSNEAGHTVTINLPESGV